MTLSRPKCVFLLSLLPTLLPGCMATDLLTGGNQGGDEDEAVAPEAPEREPYDRRGTEGTCHGWKFAYCEAIAQCDAFSSREQCEVDVGYVICREDAPLGECEAAIDAALEADRCEDLPPECSPTYIADRSTPQKLCEEMQAAICEYGLYCGLELSEDGCLDSLARTEPCSDFTAALPGAYECADAYSMLSCGSAMPEVCRGALRR